MSIYLINQRLRCKSVSAQKVSVKYRFYDQKTPYDLTAIARMPATNYAIEGNIKISRYEKYSYRNVLNFSPI